MRDDPIDPFRSVLRLFMSVDIVGSTAFKQAEAKSEVEYDGNGKLPSEAWFSPIAQFYRQIELLFGQEWKTYVEAHSGSYRWPTGTAPEFWKGVGDEVIYYKEITDHREAYCCLLCWYQVVKKYRQALKQKYPKLDVKSSAWIAGFPVNNAEIIFRTDVNKTEETQGGSDPVFDNANLLTQFYNGERAGLVRDFIGPSIDTGFRISSLATPRKLVISVDLAILLAIAEASRPHDFCYPKLHFQFDGTVSLKGVFGGNPYPAIWIDTFHDDDLEKAEDKMLGRRHVPPSDLITYCEEFFKLHGNRINRPYIPNEADAIFSKVPEKHETRLGKLREYILNEKEREQELEKSNEDLGGEEASKDDISELLKEFEQLQAEHKKMFGRFLDERSDTSTGDGH